MGMADPKELAQQILALPEPGRTETFTKVLEMVQAAITIRSFCRDKWFVTMSGGEDSGTKFDRLLKELFGLTWKDAGGRKENAKPKHKPEHSGVFGDGIKRVNPHPTLDQLDRERSD
jgi:hypothetical protein